MTGAQESQRGTEPVERFHPTSGQVTGYATLVAIVVLVVYLAFTERTLTGLRLATGAVFFGVLVWLTVLRPRATAYPDFLHIHNSVRDVLIPWTAIEDVTLGRVLSVWVHGRRHVCTGIGAPLRRGRGRATTGPADDAPVPASEMSYAQFVQDRITALVEEARRRGGEDGAGVRFVWAVPELVALVGTGLAFALSLLL